MKNFQLLILCLVFIFSCKKDKDNNMPITKTQILDSYEKFKEANSDFVLIDPSHKNNQDDEYPEWPEDLRMGHGFLMNQFSLIENVFQTFEIAKETDTKNGVTTFQFESDNEDDAFKGKAVFKISDEKTYYKLDVLFSQLGSDTDNTFSYHFNKNGELVNVTTTTYQESEGLNIKLDLDLKWSIKDKKSISISQITKMQGVSVALVDVLFDTSSKKGSYSFTNPALNNKKVDYLIDDEELTPKP